MLPSETVLGSLRPRNAERGLVEDRDGDGQDGARDQQRRDLRQHVPQHDPRVARPERARPLHVHALAHALHLRADHARRARPEQDPDHDDDVEEARPPDRGDDDHQRDVGDDEEVVGDAHQHVVGMAAEVAGDDTHGAADHHRDEGRREADDERDAHAPDQERDHVDAAVVEAEQVVPRRMAEHRPDLLVEGVRRDPRREDRHDHAGGEEQSCAQRDALVAERLQHEAPPGRASLRRRLDEERLRRSLGDPRIELEVEEVGDEIEEDDRDRQHEKGALQHRVVALQHRLVDGAADSRPREDRSRSGWRRRRCSRARAR